MSVTTAMLVFEGCDLLDVGGPYEVLLTANRLAARRSEPEPFGVVVVAPGDRAVTAYGGLGLTPSATLDDRFDLVVVPGLVDVPAALADDHLVAAVAQLADRADVVASICTGAFLLAAAGQLRDRVATTHHEDLADLAARDDVGEVRAGVRWVDSGTVVTGAGLSSGLATGLHLVDRFVGRELATATAAQIEHPWSPAEGITV